MAFRAASPTVSFHEKAMDQQPPAVSPRSLPDDSHESRPLAQRLAFLQLGEADVARLRELAPAFAEHAEAFVDSFYRHLFAFEETAQFIRDPQLVTWLREAQRRHFATLLDAEWDEGYARRRVRVGEAHARGGIEPDIFLGAYNQYLQHWVAHFSEQSRPEERARLEALGSVIRAVLLDVGLTLDAYFLQSTRRLRQALNMYWQANNELRQFAQLASHDLKTPLATVANLCDEALDEFREQMPAEAADLIEKAKLRAFRMSQTIDELLAAASQVDDGRPAAPIDSGAVIAEAVDRIAPLAREKQIEMVVPSQAPLVLGDRARLGEVLANLLSNAVKFIEHVHGRIEISATEQDGVCTFAVRDNGSGIPAEDLQRIFSPFSRLPQHQHVSGSGLGLYFAHNLVEQLHGRIWAESTPGEGTCFFVALPVAAE